MYSSGRFGFWKPTSTSSQSIQKATQSNNHTLKEAKGKAAESDTSDNDKNQGRIDNDKQMYISCYYLICNIMVFSQHEGNSSDEHENGTQDDFNPDYNNLNDDNPDNFNPDNDEDFNHQPDTQKKDFNKHQDALQLVQEVIDAALWIYHEKKIKLDNGYFPQYRTQMVQLDSCLKFYYSNSKKALKNTDEFQCSIPVNGLLLVAMMIKGVTTGFHKTGTDKSVDNLIDNPEHGREIEEMLEEWAMTGMGDHYFDDDVGGSDMEDVNVIL
ncbi:uncharacterized protein F5891DRAFT_1190361 [Suillus fuscotomentosus]|uniref:Uncharacterized protein n=1 Tax=Suillus fuscotomentosus TaxID=1912939 RepID=A0AAD4E361_9AGAM|nr:uncharacterized protein F5891DRAFT_1190361 [Suillus fuscotomentosus]KAG1898870.1 hypothetical protein F5891DRAFT_1190361 [Suillus fuscotomentosus]